MPWAKRIIQGVISDPSASVTLYTNSSGAGQSIAVYDLDMSFHVGQTTAGSATTEQLQVQIDGVVVATMQVPVIGSNVGVGKLHINAEGAQFLIANTHLITLNAALTGGAAASFYKGYVAMTVLIDVGTP